jgi:hypothetical protein
MTVKMTIHERMVSSQNTYTVTTSRSRTMALACSDGPYMLPRDAELGSDGT